MATIRVSLVYGGASSFREINLSCSGSPSQPLSIMQEWLCIYLICSNRTFYQRRIVVSCLFKWLYWWPGRSQPLLPPDRGLYYIDRYYLGLHIQFGDIIKIKTTSTWRCTPHSIHFQLLSGISSHIQYHFFVNQTTPSRKVSQPENLVL